MEEAYHELYQQFLCLRSLCLKQAALLRQLTAALQKQSGSPGLNREVIYIPTQCSHEIPPSLYEKPQPLRAAASDSAEPHRADHLLAEDMLKLCVDIPGQRMQDVKTQKVNMFTWTPSSSGFHGTSCKFPSDPKQPDEDRVQHTARMPVTDFTSKVDDLLNQAGGAMVSDVALHSHVCEFCQAVFPGDSTTRGEFLRHLYTHVT